MENANTDGIKQIWFQFVFSSLRFMINKLFFNKTITGQRLLCSYRVRLDANTHPELKLQN